MATTSQQPDQAAATAAMITKPKASLVTLPQELRDEIYSYLPLKYPGVINISSSPNTAVATTLRTAVSLSQTCRTTHADMISTFWEEHTFFYYAFAATNEKHEFQTCTDEMLRHITNFELTVQRCFSEDDAYFRLLKKKDGMWEVQLLDHKHKGRYYNSVGTKGWRNRAEERALERWQEEMQRQVKPIVDKAEEILNKDGCITLEVLRVLRDARCRRHWRYINSS